MSSSAGSEIHPLVRDAAVGILPEWANTRRKRRSHMARVAALLQEWAEARGEHPDEVLRWRALGYLHDCLRDEDPKALRKMLPKDQRDFPDNVLHGPAAAYRLRKEGLRDAEILNAVAYHTMGSPSLGDLGLATYAADFLEPGRTLRKKWRAQLREAMPQDLEPVVLDILGARIQHLIKDQRRVRPETLAFWNHMLALKR